MPRKPRWLDSLGGSAAHDEGELDPAVLFSVAAQEKEWAETLMKKCTSSASWYLNAGDARH